VVMPETDMAVATMVAERLRRRIASEPFAIQKGARTIEVTNLDRHRGTRARRQCRRRHQARRPRALPRQAGRPQPGRARRRLSGVRAGNSGLEWLFTADGGKIGSAA
jgi:hypothetical protein